ncbi:MAG: hypothetical protein CMF69_02675 [Magnetovibrio sp.]|nr:hypothetical protein [Magnetovibrio sp.]|tara:strand:- start:808 stop:2268 length:1461 start_codon:yes stop_codon:yes gene_type:complete
MFGLKKKRYSFTYRGAKRFVLGVFGVVIVMMVGGGCYALSQEEARHLLARTGFSPPRLTELETIVPLTRGEAVDFLLNKSNLSPKTPAPAWVGELPPAYKVRKKWSSIERQAFNMQNRQRLRELQSWWVTELLSTTSPLTENLVLFWHNHFTSSFQRVKWVPYLYHQNILLRQHALGDFKRLLREIVTDPAMLFFLDGRRNHAKQPNENFAREFFELFTLGEGNGYTEKDIREASRAFSGWVMRPDNVKAIFKPRRHDNGLKTILGNTGNFSTNDVVSLVLEHPRVSVHIAEKFFVSYIGGKMDRAEIERLARLFRQSNYNIRTLFRAILLSNAFWDRARRGVIIKTPSDMTIGVARLVQWRGNTTFLVNKMKSMGQEFFRPPNVKGWQGGTAWITATSLSARNRFTARLLRDLGKVGEREADGTMMMTSMKTNALLEKAMGSDMDINGLISIMLAVQPVQKFLEQAVPPTAKISALMQDPAFQMK